MMPHHVTSKTMHCCTGRLLAGLLLASLPAGLLSAGLTVGQAVERKPRAGPPSRAARAFRVEEATIADVHRAIQQGETTCTAIVQTYIERARAYNGTCTQLVTRDGASIPAVAGAVRAGSATSFPTSTTSVQSVLPRFDEYAGPPIDFGRMEATSSDPTVHQQYGMVLGIQRAGQINALSTLNLRGERSVSCKAQCDAPPASGPLAASCRQAAGLGAKPIIPGLGHSQRGLTNQPLADWATRVPQCSRSCQPSPSNPSPSALRVG